MQKTTIYRFILFLGLGLLCWGTVGSSAAETAVIQGGITTQADLVVAWQDDRNDDGIFDVTGRGLSSMGSARFADRALNPDSTGNQYRPSLASSEGGAFVTVWEDDRDGNGFYEIFMRGFWADGSQRFAEATVNTVSSGQQMHPQLAAAENGDFVVVWQDDQDENGKWQILARGFNANGSEKFAQFTVNSVSAGQQVFPQVSMSENGRFAVVWQDDSDGDGFFDIEMRGFNADGSQLFAQRTVNQTAAGQQFLPDVAMSDAGGIVVVWQDDADGNTLYEILGVRYPLVDAGIFNELQINSNSSGNQTLPRIDMNSDGAFVVVWEDDADGNGYYQVLARGFDGTGRQQFVDIVVNVNPNGQQERPDVALSNNGDFVVAWEDDVDDNGLFQIKARGFAPDGTERFGTFEVNSVADGDQRRPAVALVSSPPARIIDVRIGIHRQVNENQIDLREDYEEIVEFFADAIYEMSNGRHKVGQVTMIEGGVPLPVERCETFLFISYNCITVRQVDVEWWASQWPRASVSGISQTDGRVIMGDTFPFPNNPYDALADGNRRGAGYTLAHEYGHYFYGVYDEYRPAQASTTCTSFTCPRTSDTAVPDSVMHSQWRADSLNDLDWLNFSVPQNFNQNNAQARAFGVSGWTTLARSSNNDPRNGNRKNLPTRPFYPELVDVAPGNNEASQIDLPAEPRSNLTIRWVDISTLERPLSRGAEPFTPLVTINSGQQVISPEPAVVQASLGETRLITRLNISASVSDPNDGTTSVALRDDGVAPDAVAEDGIYSGYMAYTVAGEYEVTVAFDNEGETAVFTNLSYQTTTAPDGESYVETFPLVGESFDYAGRSSVIVGNVRADDHGDMTAAATRLLDNNGLLFGRIDRAGDRDLFALHEADAGERIVRVVAEDGALQPALRLLDEAGEPLEGVTLRTLDNGRYRYALVTLTAEQPLFIEVTDSSETAVGGRYSVSVGDLLAGEETGDFTLFLPLVVRP